jgi:hypothetical protein
LHLGEQRLKILLRHSRHRRQRIVSEQNLVGFNRVDIQHQHRYDAVRRRLGT